MQQARIPLPHLDEQRRIVDILNRANGIRRLRREALAKARQLIPALFVEMFGDPLDYQRQWPKKALGDLVAAFEGGKNLQAGSEHGGDATFRILKVSAVTWGDFRPEESKPAPEDHAPPKHHFVRDGDLLFSRANTEELVGATVLVRNPPANLLLPDKLWRVVWRQSSEVISQYALAYFQHPSIRRAMGNLATGTSASMRNISQAKLRTLQMPVPPLSLQRAFAARVADIQSIIDEQVRAAAAADQLVASLMARFFEG
jgi:type I restriction enzyme S subunit